MLLISSPGSQIFSNNLHIEQCALSFYEGALGLETAQPQKKNHPNRKTEKNSSKTENRVQNGQFRYISP